MNLSGHYVCACGTKFPLRGEPLKIGGVYDLGMLTADLNAHFHFSHAGDGNVGFEIVSRPEIIVGDENRLHVKSYEVRPSDNVIRLYNALVELMERHNGAGVAAIQVGEPLLMFVFKTAHRTPACLINPVLAKVSKHTESKAEGCLSFPGEAATICRPEKVTVSGLNQYWQTVTHNVQYTIARAVCHELDHLDGLTIFDRATDDMLEGGRRYVGTRPLPPPAP